MVIKNTDDQITISVNIENPIKMEKLIDLK